MGTLVIPMRIDYGVYVCNCTIYFYVSKHISHNMHLSMTVIFQQNKIVHAVLQSLIIDHMHPSVYWRKNIEKSNIHWRICLWVFEGTCIVKYAFKVTSYDSPQHITDIYLLFYWDLTHQFGRLNTETNPYINLLGNWIVFDTISE